MDIQAYIDSGVLHDYCIGILPPQEMVEVERLCAIYPEIKHEVESLSNSLEQYALATAVQPPPKLKDDIWDLLHNVNKEKAMDAADLPLINRFTDHAKWMRFVQGKLPQQITEDRIVTELQHTDSVIQALIISKTDFENEEHTDELESFIILEGECECTIGDNVFRLGPGGFTDIPLHTPHWVRIISPHVVAIMQRVAV